MTSAPVTVSTNAYFTGQKATVTSANTDVETSFSDILKNQKSEGEVKNPEKVSQPKKEVKAKEVSEPAEKEEVSVKETKNEAVEKPESKTPEETVTKEAEAAAEKMVEEVAEELGITVEEVMEILNGLNMVPTDLLNVENLQAVVLKAAGEVDLSSFVTNEDLFTSLKNLTQALEEVIGEVSEATGVPEAEVKEVFANLMNAETKETEVLQNETRPVVETAEDTEAAEVVETDKDVQTKDATDGTKEGADVMLERSLETAQSGNGATEGNAQNATENPFAQNIQVQTIQNNGAGAMQAVEAPVNYFGEDTMRIMEQITDYMKGQVTDGVSELEMQLHPESLGNLHIKLTAKDGVLTAQFTAQNDIVKNVLESQMVQLKENFKEQGVTVEAIEVTVESHRFDENFNQEHNDSMREQNQNSAKHNRRINLNLESLDFEEEDLTQEEKLAAEMLRENGGTVDYTA